jgi:iron complex outermembrane receptor protein
VRESTDAMKCVVMLMALGWSTSGQALADVSGAAAESEPSGTLEEIVITAQRRTEDAQKSSLSLQVLGADALDKAGIADVFSLTTQVPGLQIAPVGSTLSVFFRGVGNYNSNALGDSAIAVSVDGVFVADSTSISSNFYDLARIEMLKGPQGTLYGRNASGGALNLITQSPELGKTDGYVEVEGGNYSLRRITGALNLPLGETLAVRGAFQIIDHDGYLDTGEDDQKDRDGRIRALWEPNDAVTLAVNADYAHSGGRGNGLVAYPLFDPKHPWNSIGDAQGSAFLQSLSPVQIPLDGHANFEDNDFAAVGAQLDVKLGFAVLTLLPAYRHVSEDYSTQDGLIYGQTNRAKQRSFEARLGDDGERLKWVIGGYYYDQDQDVHAVADASALVLNTAPVYSTIDKAPSGFGELTFSVLNGLRLIGGARYTRETKSISGELLDFSLLTNPPGGGPIPNPSGGPGGRVEELIGGDRAFSATTWKAGAEYDLSSHSMLFATASTGFKSGGFYAASPGPNPSAPENSYAPEKLTAYTLGSRNRFLDDRLQINAETYYWDYKNKQESAIGFTAGGGFALEIFNAAAATLKGMSVDMRAKPSDLDTVGAFVEYNDTSYGRFVYQTPTAFYAPAGSACAASPGNPGFTQLDCSGNPLIHAPRWTGSADYAHRFPLPGNAYLTASVDGQVSAPYFLAADFTPQSHAAGYVTGNSSFSYSPASERWTATAWVRNFTNRPVYSGGNEAPLEPPVHFSGIGAPRTFGVRFKYGF